MVVLANAFYDPSLDGCTAADRLIANGLSFGVADEVGLFGLELYDASAIFDALYAEFSNVLYNPDFARAGVGLKIIDNEYAWVINLID